MLAHVWTLSTSQNLIKCSEGDSRVTAWNFPPKFQDLASSLSLVLILPSCQQNPEDGDGVIHWKVGEFSHLEAAA